MKAWPVAILSGLLGIAVGAGTVVWDFSGDQAYDTLRAEPLVRDQGSGGPQVDSNRPGRAKLELEGSPDFDFGVMTVGESQSHTFHIRNVGTKPLRLNVRQLTCLCTDAKLPSEPVAPGETADVVLQWRAEGRNLAYRHSAVLDTSDPGRRTLILTIHGQVRRIVRAEPPEVSFSRVLSHKANRTEVAVYAYRNEHLTVVHHEFLHEETRDFFQLTTRPLSPPEVAKEPGAKSGVLVTITTKPGIPLGAINQRVRLFFEALELEPLEISIKGSVVSDISLSTGYPNFDREANLLKLGQVSRKRGAKVSFSVWVKGPYRDQVALTPEEIFPNDVLQVTVGQPQTSATGAAVRIPLTVEIPAGSRFANHLGTKQGKIGHITFQTNHPEAPTLRLFVSFAVGDFD